MEKSPNAFRTISEVAETLGVRTNVLRFWETRFDQIRPVKRSGGRRFYRPDDIRLLSGIRKLLHEDGMTIRGVQKILREHGVDRVSALDPLVPSADSTEGPAGQPVRDTATAPARPIAGHDDSIRSDSDAGGDAAAQANQAESQTDSHADSRSGAASESGKPDSRETKDVDVQEASPPAGPKPISARAGSTPGPASRRSGSGGSARRATAPEEPDSSEPIQGSLFPESSLESRQEGERRREVAPATQSESKQPDAAPPFEASPPAEGPTLENGEKITDGRDIPGTGSDRSAKDRDSPKAGLRAGPSETATEGEDMAAHPNSGDETANGMATDAADTAVGAENARPSGDGNGNGSLDGSAGHGKSGGAGDDRAKPLARATGEAGGPLSQCQRLRGIPPDMLSQFEDILKDMRAFVDSVDGTNPRN